MKTFRIIIKFWNTEENNWDFRVYIIKATSMLLAMCYVLGEIVECEEING